MANLDCGRFVAVIERYEHPTLHRQFGASRRLRFDEGPPEGGVKAHHLARGTHLGPQGRVHFGKPIERQHCFFHTHMPGGRWAHHTLVAQLRQGSAEHHATGHHRQGHTGGLGHERHRTTRTRIGFDDVHLVVGHCELHIDKAPHIERCGNLVDVFADGGQRRIRQSLGRQRARRVARVNACFFDVLHHTADEHLASVVTNGINIDLGSALQKTINEHWA